jgi:hypothetical protein
VREIARKEKVADRYVRELYRAHFSRPRLLKPSSEGRQPPEFERFSDAYENRAD